jgi:hypothetical protein
MVGRDSAIATYLKTIGSKGGKTTGPTKVRGDTAHYKALAAKAAKARKKK